MACGSKKWYLELFWQKKHVTLDGKDITYSQPGGKAGKSLKAFKSVGW